MLLGYARVSTSDQNLALQLNALADAGCEKIFTDKSSGKFRNRPSFDQLQSVLREGDVVVVWRLDRLGRSLMHLVEFVAGLDALGVGFRSLTEVIDTTNSGGKLTFHIFAALAEFERNLIVERTHAGLRAARARGRVGGRRQKLSKKQQELVAKLYEQRNHSLSEICEMFKISKPTIYEYVKKSNSTQKDLSH